MLGRYMAKHTSRRHPHRPINMELALVILAPLTLAEPVPRANVEANS